MTSRISTRLFAFALALSCCAAGLFAAGAIAAVAPKVVITSPASGSFVRDTVAISCTGTRGDATSGSLIKTMAVRIDSTTAAPLATRSLQPAAASATITASWNTAALADRSLHTIYCAVRNAQGQQTIRSVSVRIDRTPPVLTLPASPVTADATTRSGAPVNYTATASDALQGPIVPSCSPASGSTFAIGTTTVSCAATDRAGNTASGSFSVTVVEPPLLTVVDDNTLLIRYLDGGLANAHRVRFSMSGGGHLDLQDQNGQIGGSGYGTFARHTDTAIELNWDGSFLSDYEPYRTAASVTFYEDPLTSAAPSNTVLLGGPQPLSPNVILPRTTSRELQSLSTKRAPGRLDFGGSRLHDLQYGRVTLHATDGRALTFRDSGSAAPGEDYYIANGTYLQLYSQELSNQTFDRVDVAATNGTTLSWDFPNVALGHLDIISVGSVTSPCRDRFVVELANGSASDVNSVWAYQEAPYPYSGWTSSMYFHPDNQYGRADNVINEWSGSRIDITAPSYFAERDYGFNTYKRIAKLQLAAYGGLPVRSFAPSPVVIPHDSQVC